MFDRVDRLLGCSPDGGRARKVVNFGLCAPSIVGPYVSVSIGVVLGIMAMIFLVYPVLLWIITRRSPLEVLRAIREPMIMAFITRSSAATSRVVRNSGDAVSRSMGAVVTRLCGEGKVERCARTA